MNIRRVRTELLLAALALLAGGCADSTGPTQSSQATPATAAKQPAPIKRKPRQPRPRLRPFDVPAEVETSDPANSVGADEEAGIDAAFQPAPQLSNDLAAPPRQRPIDEELVRDQGIRRLDGTHLMLYTDLPADPEIDALPGIFDQAFPQWCEYFGVDPKGPAAAWRTTGCLMKDKNKFWAAGLWDDDLPPFRYGFNRGTELWLYEQPSAYYRRHLLLHEGTHGFMTAHVPQPCPPWHFEGLAELLGTHRWQDGRLTLGHFPQDRGEVPEWGRIKLVKEAYAKREGLTFERVLSFGPRAHLEVEPYGWCWAAATFLDGHPRYRERFRALLEGEPTVDLNARLRETFAEDWDDLIEEWQVFIGNLEYGYDMRRTAIDFRSGDALPADGAKVEVACDKGWQSSGIHLEAGKTYDVRAKGRYQLAAGPPVWWCEPGGVSIRYHQGRPLGVLQAAVRPDRRDPAALSALLQPHEIGLHATLAPTETGTLYLRVNDSPAELADNVGTVEVEVREARP